VDNELERMCKETVRDLVSIFVQAFLWRKGGNSKAGKPWYDQNLNRGTSEWETDANLLATTFCQAGNEVHVEVCIIFGFASLLQFNSKVIIPVLLRML
jgi:hypothetical protein